MEEYRNIDKIGMNKILNDFLEYFSKIEPLIKSKNLPVIK
jgi:hypothetical protein